MSSYTTLNFSDRSNYIRNSAISGLGAVTKATPEIKEKPMPEEGGVAVQKADDSTMDVKEHQREIQEARDEFDRQRQIQQNQSKNQIQNLIKSFGPMWSVLAIAGLAGSVAANIKFYRAISNRKLDNNTGYNLAFYSSTVVAGLAGFVSGPFFLLGYALPLWITASMMEKKGK